MNKIYAVFFLSVVSGTFAQDVAEPPTQEEAPIFVISNMAPNAGEAQIFNSDPSFVENLFANTASLYQWQFDPIDELVRLKVDPYVACVWTKNGTFRLGFEFLKSTKTKPPSITNTLLLEFTTKNMIIPFDTFNQKIVLTLFADKNIYWTRDFSFNYKEAQYSYDTKKKLYWVINLEKVLSYNDLDTLLRVFSAQERVMIRIKGLEGQFDAFFPSTHVPFYKEVLTKIKEETY